MYDTVIPLYFGLLRTRNNVWFRGVTIQRDYLLKRKVDLGQQGMLGIL